MLGLAELLPESGIPPSTIGNEFGDIYENQFETAKASRLNSASPGHITDLYHTHMKPVMELGAKIIAKL